MGDVLRRSRWWRDLDIREQVRNVAANVQRRLDEVATSLDELADAMGENERN